MLVVRDLYTSYGAIAALRGISFNVSEGRVVALVGANGAGKSTALNTISGILRPDRGSLTFGDREIAGWRADRVTALGLAQVPEGRQILGGLTVEENLLLGAYTRNDSEIGRDLEEIYLRFAILKNRRRQSADLLSGGELQMLAFGLAIMARTNLLMLVVPSLGLAPLIVQEVFRIIGDLKERTTILLVEQNARKALQVADYAYVLEGGRVAQEGPAAELRNDSRIVEAYLGRKH